MATDTKFAEGIWFNEPSDKAPDFVLGKINVHRQRFTEWLDAQPVDDKGYIKLDVKRSRNEKIYISIDDFTPSEKSGSTQTEPRTMTDEDVPF